MISLIIWICAVYGLAVAAVHLMYKRSDRELLSAEHYVLITRNHGGQLEWYLRAIGWHSTLRSVPYTVTLADDSSDDDTLKIAERMGADRGLDVEVIPFTTLSSQANEVLRLSQEPELHGRSVRLVDLRKPGEASKIPYVHVK